MVGAFAVGKTSLVRRYVRGIFDEKYLTTIGVKIDKKTVMVGDIEVELILWDIEGEDEFTKVRTSYLKGASALLLVIDGTRRDSLDIALAIRLAANESVRDPYQCVALINKSDLQHQWEVTEKDIESIESMGVSVFKTSAKSNLGIEGVFDAVSRLVLNSHA